MRKPAKPEGLREGPVDHHVRVLPDHGGTRLDFIFQLVIGFVKKGG